jgi:aspartate aminotransferase-like enzyme
VSDYPALTFKIATEPWEFTQIHRLNYQTFVEEIPQHQPNETGSLVDRFDRDNTYLICLKGTELVGSVAVRDQRPFSLDQKVDNLDTYLPPCRKICELRLLSVSPGYRFSLVFPGLVSLLARYCLDKGYDLGIISGTVRQLKLYQHIGFTPFGPLVGSTAAQYQPMYLTAEALDKHIGGLVQRKSSPAAEAQSVVNLLPGPVAISAGVRQSFAASPISHRSAKFIQDFQEAKRRLCSLTRAAFVEILCGSGTLANEAVACQLSTMGGTGIILSNGEFGERLIDQAGRWGLDFVEGKVDWGEAFDRQMLEGLLSRYVHTKWLWAVHCETSTGVLNHLETLRDLCSQRDIKLCLDCISSIGTVPLDLSGIYFASAVSGKGLAGLPGLAMVFYNHPVSPQSNGVPSYFDLGLYAQCQGIPFTHPSNAFYALLKALQQFETGEERFHKLGAMSGQLRARLRAAGLRSLADDNTHSPAVITVALPEELDSCQVGEQMQMAGFHLSYQSSYLIKRNWLQFCLMGELREEQTLAAVDMLVKICSEPRGRIHNLLPSPLVRK